MSEKGIVIIAMYLPDGTAGDLANTVIQDANPPTVSALQKRLPAILNSGVGTNVRKVDPNIVFKSFWLGSNDWLPDETIITSSSYGKTIVTVDSHVAKWSPQFINTVIEGTSGLASGTEKLQTNYHKEKVKDQISEEKSIKTVLELDLVSYSDIAPVLEENLDVEAVKKFEDQIQGFIDHGLNTLELRRNDIVFGSEGDNAILIFDDAATMHLFAQAVHEKTLDHNRLKSIDLAKRWFRMGAATGTVLVLKEERRIVGSTIARAFRLESASQKGELFVDLPTFDALPDDLKNKYGAKEVIKGKREEKFNVHRCTFISIEEEASSTPDTTSESLLTNKNTSIMPDGTNKKVAKLIEMWEGDVSYPRYRKAVDTVAFLSSIDDVPADIINSLDHLSKDGNIGSTAKDVFAVVKYLRSLLNA